ncbi:MAG TPA: S8 family serine peptidase [Ferruginibacter sp.]|nr:S8 family serine peptidase [Ferruginibacter sp.]
MKKSASLLAIPVLVLIFFSSCQKESTTANVVTPTPVDPGTCVTGSSITNGTIIPGQYIVTYNSGEVTRTASPSTMMNTSEDVMERNDISSTAVLGTFAGEPGGFVAKLSDLDAAKLNADPSIKTVEPDRIISLGGCFTIAEPRLITWNINRVGYGDGRGKTAWIIDTGIDMAHPDLNADGTRSRSFIAGITSANDDNGHGTHVAGIIGAKNNSIGVLGVASGANLVALKVLDSTGTGSLSAIIQALAYVNTNASAGDVVNMSLGLEDVSPTLTEQVLNTANRGILIAIAAGNSHQEANKTSPANANGANVYTVSAIDSLDRFASFSNYGNDVVDYAQPGVNILSTYTHGRYAYMSGTSMAAPHLAGLLLLRGRNLNVSGTAKNDPDGVADPIAHY